MTDAFNELLDSLLTDPNRGGTVLPLYRDGGFEECVPLPLRPFIASNMKTDPLNLQNYYDTLLRVAQSLFLYEDTEAEPIQGIRRAFGF